MTDLDFEFDAGQSGEAWRLPKVRSGRSAAKGKAGKAWSRRRGLAVFLLCALGSWAIVLTPILLYWYI